MEYIKLNNGVEMPQIGYGVFQIDNKDCERCVLDAIEVGYRAIDTAQLYANEDAVGRAVANSGVPRNEIFLTTKVWFTNFGYEKTLASLEESMRKLQTDYLDMVLLHWPYNDYFGAWRALEKMYKEGRIRSIGVSNLPPARFLDLVTFTDVVPAVNQVMTNVFIHENAMQVFLEPYGTKITAWSPLTQGQPDFFSNECLKGIGAKYGKSNAQVALRWLIQRGIIAIPKSTHKERMQENLNVFDFNLTDEDMRQIATLNRQDTSLTDVNDEKFTAYVFENYKLQD